MTSDSENAPANAGQNHLTYKDSGVDIDAGNALVDAIKPLAASTARPGSASDEDGGLGGFGGAFDLKAAEYKDPILIAANDGVGTKLKIAIETGIHDTVGIDLVAMCVNDLVVQGAAPLFFLDYLATGALDVDQARDVVAGIAEGCRQANCALIGGETAEMPGMYQSGDYDLAGFSVGAAERGSLLPLTGDMKAGDVLIGLASSGVHSNGFSLVRKVLEIHGLGFDSPAPFADGQSLGQAFLTPTRIYVRSALAALEVGGLKGLAHITGGGLTENLPRALPDGLNARIDLSSWSLPPVFNWLAQAAGLEASELLRTFNCGIGMIAIADADKADDLMACFTDQGETAFVIGQLTDGEGDAGVTYEGDLN